MIGTLAREAAEQGHEVFIVSGDKDMMQLVTPQRKGAQSAEGQPDPRSGQGDGDAGRAAGKGRSM